MQNDEHQALQQFLKDCFEKKSKKVAETAKMRILKLKEQRSVLKDLNTDLVAVCRRLLSVLESVNGHDYTISDDAEQAVQAAQEIITRVESNK